MSEQTFDIVLDDDGELVASSYDFKTGDAVNNYLRYILDAFPGNYKEFPVLGVGIDQYLNSNINPQQLERAIRVQLENDVFKKPLIDLKNWPTLIVNKTVVEL
jgi:hypothetical protein